jgi:sterol desaturase/sphingolipid hydroxylase (fatty acid hydroxylase superfamily)
MGDMQAITGDSPLIDAILGNQTGIRLTVFFGILALMMALEAAFPRRIRNLPRKRRWPANIAIVFLNSLLIRALFPMAAVGVAAIADINGWGLFNVTGAPLWLAITASVILLDFAIYAQHVVFHKVPALWRLHRMHHADLDIDVTTGARFHPIEIILSMAIKMVVVVALGAPAVAVVIFEVLLNGTAMFNHANFKLPLGIDRIVRLVFVTPDMHRVHHSAIRRETDSNYGFNLTWWDRLCRTYRPQPIKGHDGMIIGLEFFRDPIEQRLDKMLLQPLKEAVVEIDPEKDDLP